MKITPRQEVNFFENLWSTGVPKITIWNFFVFLL